MLPHFLEILMRKKVTLGISIITRAQPKAIGEMILHLRTTNFDEVPFKVALTVTNLTSKY